MFFIKICNERWIWGDWKNESYYGIGGLNSREKLRVGKGCDNDVGMKDDESDWRDYYWGEEI